MTDAYGFGLLNLLMLVLLYGRNWRRPGFPRRDVVNFTRAYFSKVTSAVMPQRMRGSVLVSAMVTV